MKGLMLVDISMVMHRCMNRMDEIIINSKGISTGLEFGSLRILQSLTRKFPDHKLIVCFDSHHNKKSVDPKYKAQRGKMDKVVGKRIGAFSYFVKNLYTFAEKDGLEADDILHSLSRGRGDHYLYTNDNDLLQSVSENVTVLKSFQSKLFYYTPEKVKEKYGVTSERLSLFRSYTGDKSDNLPGVERIPKAKLARFVNGLSVPTVTCAVKNELEEFSENMVEKITEFTHCGQLDRNYKLMNLVYHDVTIREPEIDKDYVNTMLRFWEIFSLDICKDRVTVECEEF